MKEYVERLEAAQSRLDWATKPKEVDSAIFEIIAAETALAVYVEERKMEENVDFVKDAQN